MIYKDIKVCFGGEFSAYTDTVLVSGDKRAYRIVYVTPFDLSGASFKVTAKRANGTVVEDIGYCEENTAYYVIKNNMYEVEGDVAFYLSLCGANGEVLTAKEINAVCIPAYEADSSGDDRVPALTAMIEATAKAAENANTQAEYAKDTADSVSGLPDLVSGCKKDVSSLTLRIETDVMPRLDLCEVRVGSVEAEVGDVNVNLDVANDMISELEREFTNNVTRIDGEISDLQDLVGQANTLLENRLAGDI